MADLDIPLAKSSKISHAAAEICKEAFNNAVDAVKPRKIVQKWLEESLPPKTANTSQDGATLLIHQNGDRCRQVTLGRNGGKTVLLGFGKAVYQMAEEFLSREELRPCVSDIILSIPFNSVPLDRINELKASLKAQNFEVFQGAKNNLPDQTSLQATQASLDALQGLCVDDTVIVCLSGGGSALACLPADGISLEDKLAVTKQLAGAGATIQELNSVRKCISAVKGGRLARAAFPATVITLILSDVIGSPIEYIASGPTVEASRHDSPSLALSVLKKYGLVEQAPESVRNHLAMQVDQSPSAELQNHEDNVFNIVIGDNSIAADAVVASLERSGVRGCVLTLEMSGEAKAVGALVSQLCLALQSKQESVIRAVCTRLCISEDKVDQLLDISRVNDGSSSFSSDDEEEENFPVDKESTNVPPKSTSGSGIIGLVLAGETTVTLQGSGKGGRNQEMALASGMCLHHLSAGLHAIKDVNMHMLGGVAILCAGTDGQDGPTDAAGGVVFPSMFSNADEELLESELKDNDSYESLSRLGGLLKTGLTGTNVMDLCIAVLPV